MGGPASFFDGRRSNHSFEPLAAHTFGYKTQLNSMRQAAMQRVFSWKEASQNYLSVYSRAGKTA